MLKSQQRLKLRVVGGVVHHLPQKLGAKEQEKEINFELKPKRDQLQRGDQNMVKSQPNQTSKNTSEEEGKRNILPEENLRRKGLEVTQI